MAALQARGRSGESGKGIIGFIVALVVVGYVGNAMFRFYTVKSRYDTLNDYAYEALGEAERMKLDRPEKVVEQIKKRAAEIGVKLTTKDVTVVRESSRWTAHLEWEDVVKFPGYEKKVKYTVDKSFTRF